MANDEREGITGIRHRQERELFGGAVKLAFGVRARGAEMAALAVRETRAVADLVEDRTGVSGIGALRREAPEVGPSDVPHGETRVIDDGRLPGVDDVVPEAKERFDGGVVAFSRFATRGREWQAGTIPVRVLAGHRFPPRWSVADRT
ncbi:MAG TPA: hypothetical protein VHF24_01640 [Acidimicrobiales bacterium]|nr:hypothetical protein [Acidimicrobiales bacterium]